MNAEVSKPNRSSRQCSPTCTGGARAALLPLGEVDLTGSPFVVGAMFGQQGGATTPAQVQVAWEDQSNINRFNKLNNEWHELQARVQRQERLTEDLEDASNELMLVDDDEVRFAMSDCLFVRLPQDEVEVKLQEEAERVKKDYESTKEEVEKIGAEMAMLKTRLYEKFGNAINLEEEV
ncbi:unnamed protein product [Ostreobium quekettii]|uniref:Prefoldin subunit 4 n=1 Tax=Ostreobium quekettii TaxID=121088 RepID=A0A8S1IWS7_9CHLO|nr:unnamed protein product [Ostreobium quekettii]|eukprot:evm.model.scf_162EXC.9 EVM.evm.TU.scf_162EXC.9   scf_162EXC:62769-64083(+)